MNDISLWPNDEEASERCICGHILVEHEYGGYYANCDYVYRDCPCNDFESQHAYIDAYWVAKESRRRKEGKLFHGTT